MADPIEKKIKTTKKNVKINVENAAAPSRDVGIALLQQKYQGKSVKTKMVTKKAAK